MGQRELRVRLVGAGKQRCYIVHGSLSKHSTHRITAKASISSRVRFLTAKAWPVGYNLTSAKRNQPGVTADHGQNRPLITYTDVERAAVSNALTTASKRHPWIRQFCRSSRASQKALKKDPNH